MEPITQHDILAAIDALGKETPKRPSGDGWKTVPQMAREKGIHVSSMRRQLRIAISRGLQVERFVGSGYDATGRVNRQTWFRVKR